MAASYLGWTPRFAGGSFPSQWIWSKKAESYFQSLAWIYKITDLFQLCSLPSDLMLSACQPECKVKLRLGGSNLLLVFTKHFTNQSAAWSVLSRWQCSSQRAAGGTLHNKTNLTNSLSYTILIDHHIFFLINNSEQFDGDPGRIAPLFENDHNTHTPFYGNIR